MDIMRPFARYVAFPLNARREGVMSHLRALEESQYWPEGKLQDLAFRRLKALLEHAYLNCPFYRERFDRCGFRADRIQGPADIETLPFLTKTDIQNHRESLRAQNWAPQQLELDRTGGSTGHPLEFYRDPGRTASRLASGVRHDRWTGWNPGDKLAYFWGAPASVVGRPRLQDRVRNLVLDRRIVFDTSNITRERLAQFKTVVRRFDPFMYVAYANSIYLYALFLRNSGSTDHHRPKAIVTSAEVLADDRRRLIEEVFGCPVFDRYGAREVAVIASECDHHQGLHICAETLLVEFVSRGGPAGPGDLGRVVITDLLNFGMPMLRYEIGDVGAPAAGRCTCGRGLPRMKMAAGRVTDFLATPGGRIVSGAALTIHLVAKAPGVAQAQLVQERVDELTIKVVPKGRMGDETYRFFEREVPIFLGDGIRLRIEVVDEIPAEASGKHRFSISTVDLSEFL